MGTLTAAISEAHSSIDAYLKNSSLALSLANARTSRSLAAARQLTKLKEQKEFDLVRNLQGKREQVLQVGASLLGNVELHLNNSKERASVVKKGVEEKSVEKDI